MYYSKGRNKQNNNAMKTKINFRSTFHLNQMYTAGQASGMKLCRKIKKFYFCIYGRL